MNTQTLNGLNAKELINLLRQLPRSDRITLARSVLAIERPNNESKIDLPGAMSLVSKLPPNYRHPLILLLAESDRRSNGNSLCVEDAINMAHTLLMLTQDHEARDVSGSVPATIPHDLILEMDLQKLLHDGSLE